MDRKTLEAAVRGRGTSGMKLLGVTVLTNLGSADLVQQGIDQTAPELVLRRATLAQDAGFDGVIASAQEAAAIRKKAGAGFLIVTPGIRPRGLEANDQARTMTPAEAIAAGADYLVIGRPITRCGRPARCGASNCRRDRSRAAKTRLSQPTMWTAAWLGRKAYSGRGPSWSAAYADRSADGLRLCGWRQLRRRAGGAAARAGRAWTQTGHGGGLECGRHERRSLCRGAQPRGGRAAHADLAKSPAR